jgi:hypothetical protein
VFRTSVFQYWYQVTLHENSFILIVIKALKCFVGVIFLTHAQFVTLRLSVVHIICNFKCLMHDAGHITVLQSLCTDLPNINDGLLPVCDSVYYCCILLATLLFIVVLEK